MKALILIDPKTHRALRLEYGGKFFHDYSWQKRLRMLFQDDDNDYDYNDCHYSPYKRIIFRPPVDYHNLRLISRPSHFFFQEVMSLAVVPPKEPFRKDPIEVWLKEIWGSNTPGSAVNRSMFIMSDDFMVYWDCRGHEKEYATTLYTKAVMEIHGR